MFTVMELLLLVEMLPLKMRILVEDKSQNMLELQQLLVLLFYQQIRNQLHLLLIMQIFLDLRLAITFRLMMRFLELIKQYLEVLYMPIELYLELCYKITPVELP
jgi:hypothetical protein